MNFISFYNVVSHTRRDSQDSSIEPSKYQEQNWNRNADVVNYSMNYGGIWMWIDYSRMI